MRRLGWLALPLCVLAGACGGDDRGQIEDGAGAPTPEEFLAEGNAACSKYNEGIRIVYDNLPAKPTTKAYNGYVDVFVLGTRSALATIIANEFPSKTVEEEFLAIWEAEKAILDRVEAEPRLLSAQPGLFDGVYARLKEMGLVACAR